ncbi:aldolase/citrate lyase family protein [Candidatus Bathyarchaeota archaeon]|jgi:2-keto-3-deoxy-L-rhamnonate aldolase RhmA|nr:aldolase/citrate lyase family protein [Candidatus Bathyarchaeota archaeon]
MANKIRELIKANKPTIGTHLSSTWPTLWEAIGVTGQMDYIEFGSQYGAWDLHDFDNMCRAAELTGLGSMIKIDRHPKDWVAQRAIAAGFNSILFADVMNAREAKECVEAVKLPPEGVNGFVGTRGVRVPDYAQAVDDIVIALMIEKKSLMAELDKVLAIDGIDMIQFGPTDYGLSMRTPGKPYKAAEFKEKVEADRDKAHEMAIKAGVRPRAEAGNAKECQYYLDRGVRDFCIGWDTGTVAGYCMREGKELRSLLKI